MSSKLCIKKLREVCTINPPKKEAKERLDPATLVSFVPMSNVSIYSKNILLDSSKPLAAVYKSYTYFSENDVLLAKITPCFENGKLGIARSLSNGVGFGSSEYIVLRANIDTIPDYIYYFLSQASIRSSGASIMTGAVGHKRIPEEYIASLPIYTPIISEQRRIVAILDDAFERIDKAIANTEKNIANAKELFESCLESTFANIVGKTTSCKIKECTKFIDYRGKTPEKTECGLRLITAKNVKKGVLQKTPEEFVSPEVYDTWMTRGIPKIGDVLFTTEAPLGNVAQLDTSEKVVFAQRIIIIQPAAKILDSRFFKYLLLSPQMQKTIDSLGTGATAKGIKAKVLKEIEITFPQALSAQVCIAERLEQTENFCRDVGSKLVQKISALQALKQSLLAAAFSGELTADFNPDALEQ